MQDEKSSQNVSTDGVPLLAVTGEGLYCAAGDFHIDPWRPVPRAVITHAHSDHARRGCGHYLCSQEGRHVLAGRLDADAVIDTVAFGEPITRGGVRVSLHGAGHILGSSQIRVEHRGEVWVVSGDYKTDRDRTCTPWEPVRCHTFISECTFGLPIYRWPDQQSVFDEINQWWRASAEEGRTAVLFAYSLGKSQRILAGLDPSIGPIFCHGAVEGMNRAYRETGIVLPETQYAGRKEDRIDYGRGIVIAPGSAAGTPWMRKFGDYSAAFASGWMRVRGTRRRRAVDRGFVLSDHVDWPGVLSAIKETSCERVLLTHGATGVLERYLRQHGQEAYALATHYSGESDDTDEHAPETDQSPESES